MLTRRLALASVAIILAALFGTTAPAGAATPTTADGLAVASFGSKRAVVWLKNHGVFLQRLQPNGALDGPRVSVGSFGSSTVLGDDVSATMAPDGGVLLSVPEWQDNDGDEFDVLSPLFVYIGPDDHVEFVGAICGDNELNVFDGTIPTGSATWDRDHFLLVGACLRDGMVVRGFVPGGPGFSIDFLAPAGEVHSASIASVGAGGFSVVYDRLLDDDFDVWARRYTETGTVRSTVLLAGEPGPNTRPAVAASGGRFLAAWVDGVSGNLSGRPFGTTGAVGTRRTLVNAAGRQHHPALARAADGGWHLTWTDLRNGTADVFAAKVSSTVAVSPVNGRLVAGGPGAQSSPTIATRPNGAAFVGYLDLGVGKIRDLTAAGAPIGSTRTVTLLP
jgi:hypothetical protein